MYFVSLASLARLREAHFRHRVAPVSHIHPSLRSDVDLLCQLSALTLATGQAFTIRPSATVAAWHPGPATPVRGKASIPPVFVSTGSGAALRRDLLGFASAGVHPCPNNGPDHKFQSYFPASTGPASFLADPDHASVIHKSNKLQKEAATAPETSGSGRCRCGANNYSAKFAADASTITSSYVM